MPKWILTILISLIGALGGYARGFSDAYEKEQFTAKNGFTVNYRLLRPDTINVKMDKYPLVLFLHGSGERGNDNHSQLDNGGSLFANKVNRIEFPSYVIFPQCPEDCFWSYKSAPTKPGPEGLKEEKQEMPLMMAISELVDSYREMPDVDPDRIYIVGISMGGMAVYDVLCRHPQTFAAGITICGAVDPDRLITMKDVPIRIFHGDQDEVIPLIAAKMAYDKLKAIGGDAELIEFPNAGHDSWDQAFEYPDFLKWLYSHKKGENISVNSSANYAQNK